MSKVLKLSADLSLPLDAVTQTFLIVGKRGSGKSNTAARFVEQLHHARLPFVVLDPVDTWWGLKAGRDGGKGLDVYVFGGRKQDLPLNATDGALIADVLCEHRVSMVLSVKHLSGRERSKFMVAFAQTLFQKWSGGQVHVVLEEAHELAPQMSGGRGQQEDGDAAMLGAFKRLWKLGRASGIGGTAITQRPASLSKDITTQSEILIAHRTIGPQDVKAVGEWVKYHGEQLGILAELPTLPTGEAFVWAPEFPEGKAIGLQRTIVQLRETYDSASTPKVGEQRIEPKELAAVDLDRLRAKMATTIERAKADDPKELRKQLAEKDRQIRALEANVKTSSTSLQTKAELVLTEADLQRLSDLVHLLKTTRGELANHAQATVSNLINRLRDFPVEAEQRAIEHEQRASAVVADRLEKAGFQRILEKLERVTVTPSVPPRQPNGEPGMPTGTGRVTQDVPPRQVGRSSDGARPAGAMPGPQRGPLVVLANNPRGCEIGKLALLSGKHISGGFKNILAELRSQGWMVGENTGVMTITPDGIKALGQFDALPTGDALGEYWLNNPRLSAPARELLRELLKRREGYDIATLAQRVNKVVSGGFKNLLAELRTAGVVVGRNTEIMRASEELFS